jgi:hypothetical protein
VRQDFNCLPDPIEPTFNCFKRGTRFATVERLAMMISIETLVHRIPTIAKTFHRLFACQGVNGTLQLIEIAAQHGKVGAVCLAMICGMCIRSRRLTQIMHRVAIRLVLPSGRRFDFAAHLITKMLELCGYGREIVFGPWSLVCRRGFRLHSRVARRCRLPGPGSKGDKAVGDVLVFFRDIRLHCAAQLALKCFECAVETVQRRRITPRAINIDLFHQ